MVEVNKTVKVGNLIIGGEKKILIAGPCAVDDKIEVIAEKVKAQGAHILRGGAFKPRTDPNSFQGDEIEGLKALKKAGDKVGLPVITEATGIARYKKDGTKINVLESVIEYADIIQLGARSGGQQDFLNNVGYLTHKAGDKPILYKRPLGISIPQYVQSIGFLTQFGNKNIICCLRGEQKAENTTLRYKSDMNQIKTLKEQGFIVIYDPSHTTGDRNLVIEYAKKALEEGADGVMIETHIDPNYEYCGERVCDGMQMILPEELSELKKHLLNGGIRTCK